MMLEIIEDRSPVSGERFGYFDEFFDSGQYGVFTPGINQGYCLDIPRYFPEESELLFHGMHDE